MRSPLWLVDLDNTLYDASWPVMGEINRRMTRYVEDALSLSHEDASALREYYWHRYGATLLGLVARHKIDPNDFLEKTHPTRSLPTLVQRIPGERFRLRQLNGRRWLLTNAPRAYAQHLLDLFGLSRVFDRVISIEEMVVAGRLRPKPSKLLMRRVLRQTHRPATRVVLVDDHSENLRSAHQLGIRTARIWASGTALRQARHSGRPLSVRRPGYVRLQVHSLGLLVRHQHLLVKRS
jgi:putative hydrolase of the HAD superfamily